MNKKVAFAIHSIGDGGAERVTTILCNRFVENGYEVHLICNIHCDWEYPLSVNVIRHFIGDHMSGQRIINVFKRIMRMRQICRRERFDAIIGMMKMGEYTVFATAGLHIPNIISVRNAPDILYPSFLQRLYARFTLSMSSGAVFQTEDASRWFPQRLQNKSKIIFNPVDRKFFNVDRVPEQGLLMATGRLTTQKNYPMMLKAVAEVLKNHDVKLEIYGKGELEEDIYKLVTTLGIESKVKFCGQCNDIPSVLRRADIFLLSSDYEGMPNGLMEAMAIGIPAVATDCPCGGVRMLFGQNERGIISPVGDYTAFANNVTSLLKMSQYKEQLGLAAKKFAQRFSVDNCLQDWEDFINSKILCGHNKIAERS